jgi:hypothetical protein
MGEGLFDLLRVNLSKAGNGDVPGPDSIDGQDGKMITMWVRNIYGTKGQKGDSCTTRCGFEEKRKLRMYPLAIKKCRQRNFMLEVPFRQYPPRKREK